MEWLETQIVEEWTSMTKECYCCPCCGCTCDEEYSYLTVEDNGFEEFRKNKLKEFEAKAAKEFEKEFLEEKS